jgi:hypothetical protein
MLRIIGILCCAVIAYSLPSLGWAESYRPRILLELHIEPRDVSELHEVLQAFASAEGLILRDVGSVMPPIHGKALIYFTLHRAETLQVIVRESVVDGGVRVAFSDLQSDPQFEKMASELQTTLKRRWQVTTAPSELPTKARSEPDVILGLHVGPEEIDELRNVVEAFAQTEGFVLKDEGSWMPKDVMNKGIVALRLTRDTGLQVFIGDLQGTGQFHVAFYDSHSGYEFKEVVSALKNTLQQKWPVHELE